jgi:hypothetical protein
MKRTIGATLVCLFVATVSEAQPVPTFHASVRLIVDSNDAIKDQIVSYTNAALRKLPDVTIVDDHSTHELRIVALELLTTPPAAILSWVVVESPRSPEASDLVVNDLLVSWPESQKATVRAFINANASVLPGFLDQGVVTEPSRNLRDGCERVVASFDARALEAARKQWQQTWQAVLRKGKPDNK